MSFSIRDNVGRRFQAAYQTYIGKVLPTHLSKASELLSFKVWCKPILSHINIPPTPHQKSIVCHETCTGCRDGNLIATHPWSSSSDLSSSEFCRRLEEAPAIAIPHIMMMRVQDFTAGHSRWPCSKLARCKALVQACSLKVDASTKVVSGSPSSSTS